MDRGKKWIEPNRGGRSGSWASTGSIVMCWARSPLRRQCVSFNSIGWQTSEDVGRTDHQWRHHGGLLGVREAAKRLACRDRGHETVAM